MLRALLLAAVISSGAVLGSPVFAATTVFSTDFSAELPAEFTAPGAAIEPEQV